MAREFDTEDPRYTALYIGEVVEREDPEGLGRVRVRIPGLIEPASAWAFPLGTVGGGSDRRGLFAVPEKGAEVGVLFHQGDVDHPFYLCGHWGKPNGEAEVPESARGLSKEEAPQVRAFETGRFLLTFDDRGGKEALIIKDKKSGDQVEFDGVGMGITIKATSALLLKADGLVSIEAASVQINGRMVLHVPTPI
jgi:uncharacterized protein involved in type VI secretion and phage assembly